MNSFFFESLSVYNCKMYTKLDNFTVNSTCLNYLSFRQGEIPASSFPSLVWLNNATRSSTVVHPFTHRTGVGACSVVSGRSCCCGGRRHSLVIKFYHRSGLFLITLLYILYPLTRQLRRIFKNDNVLPVPFSVIL